MWRGREGRILLLGLGMLVCFVALTLLYLSVPQGFTQPRGWTPRRNHSVEVSALYRQAFMLPNLSIPRGMFRLLNWLLILLTFGCYAGVLRFASTNRLSRATLVTTCLLILVLLPMPPLFASDIFTYAIAGQIAGQFGGNPYIQTPEQFPQSLFLSYNYWINIPTPYGPVWTLLSSTVVTITGSGPWITTLGFKLVAVMSVGFTAWLIWKLLREVSPDYAAKGTLMFLWNPLVLLETVGNAHNEAPMVALTLAGALFLYRQATARAFLCLLIATFLKYLVAPVLVFYAAARLGPHAAVRRERLRRAAMLVGLGIIVTLIVWAPYWEGLQTISSLAAEPSRGLTGFTATAILRAGGLLNLPNALSIEVARIASLIALGAVGFWILWRLVLMWHKHHTYSFTDELHDWAYSMLLIPITMPRAHPWYLLTALALFAVIAPQARKGASVAYVLAILWFIYRVCFW